jgi:uncharacterized membrane protein (DUF485 family)
MKPNGPIPESLETGVLRLTANARLGLFLFAIYCLVYFSFVLVNAFAPRWMSDTTWAGLNLAVLWGMGLIVLAFGLSLIYGLLCRSETDAKSPGDSSPSA